MVVRKLTMDVSIAMCTYNGARYLDAQLGSIAAQTRQPAELVVCDDGSTDATEEIVRAFAASVSFPVRWVRNERNLGSTKNFEKAIGLCRGGLIALCDQDDAWMPEKLERLAGVLERAPKIAGVFSDALLMDDNGAPVEGTLWARFRFTDRDRQLFGVNPTYSLMKRPIVTGATLMFRASFLQQLLPIGPDWVHDEWIALLLAAAARIEPIPERLIRYRLHAAQQIGVRRASRRELLRTAQVRRIAFFERHARKYPQITEKLAGFAGSEKAVQHARAKAAYMHKRAELLRRGLPARVLRGLTLLPGHFRYGSGVVSYLRDFAHA